MVVDVEAQDTLGHARFFTTQLQLPTTATTTSRVARLSDK